MKSKEAAWYGKLPWEMRNVHFIPLSVTHICVTVGLSFNLSVPQFLHLENENDDTIPIFKFYGWNMIWKTNLVIVGYMKKQGPSVLFFCYHLKTQEVASQICPLKIKGVQFVVPYFCEVAIS